MGYREKVAWLMFSSMAVTLGPYLIYVYVVQNGQPIPLPGIGELKLYATAAVSWAVIIGTGHLLLRLKFPSDTRTPADERDHEIERRSFRIGYFILIIGMIVIGIFKPFYSAGWSIINGTILMIAVAELVRYLTIVHSYRKQRP
ncbi:hypothetical protein LY625_13275 [Lysobacter sp. GX 14042]|uniref:hypothetical protein n=1 Tax=Lysobacter sp. GX 14042 TaxID=2907155 RepID=UPI001F2A52A9|nr:hypothetical protein [Lysobacter sp. GX 14042]MCE7033568.1 hypothetical protein [Lysobacter sp. GX 14042]